MSVSMDDVIRSIIGSRTLIEAKDGLEKLGLSYMSAQTLLDLPLKEISRNTIVIGSRFSGGKTAFAMDIALNAVSNNHPDTVALCYGIK